MANEAGPGCKDLDAIWTNDTVISYETADTAGTITAYRVQMVNDPALAYDIEFALFTESGGDYSYISGTETGVKEVTVSGGVCQEFTAGVDFTPTTQASIGDYVGCWYESSQEFKITAGNGAAVFYNTNVCESSSQTPDYTNVSADCAIGADISGGGSSPTVSHYPYQMNQ